MKHEAFGLRRAGKLRRARVERAHATHKVPLGALLAGVAASFLWACAPPSDRPDVVLISLDTLRSDHLSTYGYERATSPNFDLLAQQGVLFEAAHAPASNTAPSHMSFFTGLDPHAHGVHPVTASHAAADARQPVTSLHPDLPTLPEVLQAHGWSTTGLLDDGFLLKSMGFERGFDRVHNKRTTLVQKLDKLEGFLQRWDRDEPQFLFFHTYEPHSPYLPPRQYHGRFTHADYDGEFRMRYERLLDLPLKSAWNAKGHFLDSKGLPEPDSLEFLRGLYDEGIAYTDWGLGEFWRLWSEHRDASNTLLVIVSDHGEGFGEHGHLGHSYGLRMELLRVPLLIIGPGLTPGRVSDPVGLVELMPTMLELLGLPAVPSSGPSFAPLARLQAMDSGRAVHSQFSRINGVDDSITLNGLRLLRTESRAEVKLALFDLKADPFEANDLAAERGPSVQGLLKLLDRRRAEAETWRKRYPAGNGSTLSKEDEEDLRALGYLGEDQ